MNKFTKARNILETANNACDCTNDDYTFSELKEIIQEIIDNIENNEDDFDIDSLAGGEVRIINEASINEIWEEGLLNTLKDCYEIPEDLPSFFVIDWDQTVENCKIDGLGHHFNSYDGNEYNTSGFYIFRTN